MAARSLTNRFRRRSYSRSDWTISSPDWTLASSFDEQAHLLGCDSELISSVAADPLEVIMSLVR
jgi:hypothetical protein